jgi:hypothetical protein
MDMLNNNQHNGEHQGVTSQVLTVVGGRMVPYSYSSNVQFTINGQQLMMQMDSLTSNMMDMAVTTDADEVQMVVKTKSILEKT